ncbi:hypothetical protein FSP39_012293 [Pinctada imbricata]|uniref:Uncharacterized protein n=1 Tax=Pinctada imbricata TaxID=66713 RepID=A0AA88XDP9_PINIB|nr:hypothetical protein FSP39_012293 [Pinctada imbricata]
MPTSKSDIELQSYDEIRDDKITLKSYPSSWSLTSQSPLISRKRTDSVSSGPHTTDLLNKRDTKGRTQLYVAAKNGDVTEASRLLKAGADPNIADPYGVTALHEAVERSLLDIVELLIRQGSNINAKTILGQTPLMRAVLYDDTDIIKILLKAGANIDDFDCTGKTALLVGLQENRKHACSLLIRDGCDVNVYDRLGHTAMYYALRSLKEPNLTMARKLMKNGYDLKKDGAWLKESERADVITKHPSVIGKVCNKLGIRRTQSCKK